MKMVGLSVVLEAQKGSSISKKTPQVINKATMMLGNGDISKSSPTAAESSCQHSVFQAPTFLDQCFLCRKRLLPGKDIFMYQGDRAFCSVECRYKQIFADEEESFQRENCSFVAMRPTSSASSSASSTPRHRRKGTRNRPGAFAC